MYLTKKTQKMKYYVLTFCEDWADEFNVPAIECFTEDEFNQWKETSLMEEIDEDEEDDWEESKITTYLGNSGEDFEEMFKDYKLAGELIEADIVRVAEVDENFYKIFKDQNISRLSLCNIFEIV